MMKSTPITRDALLRRLQDALKGNPDSKELRDAIDIVDDLIHYHSDLSRTVGLFIIRNPQDNMMYFYHPPTMQCLGKYQWDGSSEDLGILVESHLQ